MRVEKLRLTPSMKKILDKAVALRTSALCRDDEGRLIIPPEIEFTDSTGEDSDDTSVAVVAVLLDWTDKFNRAELAALRNGHE